MADLWGQEDEKNGRWWRVCVGRGGTDTSDLHEYVLK